MRLSPEDREQHNEQDLRMLNEYLETGSIDILGELFRKYMPLIYGVCLKYLSNREESQDAVMSIFEKLVTEAGKHSVSNFRSWLYVMTKNYCLMSLRSKGSERDRLKLAGQESSFFMENGYELHPVDREDEINDRALEECIEKLKREQKECIRLFYYEKMSYIEISARLDLDEKKVKSHLQNAKRNLKICLETGHE